jgi:sulfonate transport system substrate-binding protein
MSRSRPVLLLAALAALAVSLTACSSSSSATASSSSKPTAAASASGASGQSSAVDLSAVTLRVGQTGWNEDGAALQVAGLANTPYKIKWAVFSGGDKQLQALQAGALDVANTSDIPPVFAAAATPPGWRVVAVQRANTLLQNVVAGKKSGITSIAQLKGKKVGYVQSTTAQYFLYKLLVQNGLTWSDIHAVALTPQDGVAALSSGSIDALASYGNSIITTEQQGAKVIGSGQDILSGDFPWEASNNLIGDSAQSAALVDLFSRINKAYAYIRDGHEAQYAALTAAATDEPKSEALSQIQSDEQQQPTTFTPTSAAQTAKEQDVANAFTSLGVLPGKVDVASYWSEALNAPLTTALAGS